MKDATSRKRNREKLIKLDKFRILSKGITLDQDKKELEKNGND